MKLLIKKILALIITLFLVSFFAFFAFQSVTGDPALNRLGTEATPEELALLREEMGLNRPILARYGDWVLGFFNGDLGESYTYHEPVSKLLAQKLPVTAAMSVMSLGMIVLLSIPVGIWAARNNRKICGKAFTVFNQVLMSVPPFFLGMLFVWVFGLILRWFVPGNYISWQDSPSGFLKYLFFPALTIALPRSAMAVRMLKGSVLSEMKQDYVRTARARGNSEPQALRRHVLRNAMLPVTTFFATTFAGIISAGVIVEQVFTVPGIGRLLLSSISSRDYPVVQAIIVLIASLVITVNFLADICYQLLDPRIHLS